jgi:hypothetical protein
MIKLPRGVASRCAIWVAVVTLHRLVILDLTVDHLMHS